MTRDPSRDPTGPDARGPSTPRHPRPSVAREHADAAAGMAIVLLIVLGLWWGLPC